MQGKAITLISPRIAIQKGDFLGSGVPYWPIELATLASLLRNRGDAIKVIDALGDGPSELEDRGDHYLQGSALEKYQQDARISGAHLFIIYAMSYMSHQDVLGICQKLKTWRPNAHVIILENSQAVTAYSLPDVRSALFDAGADILICGEPYHNWEDIAAYLTGSAPKPENLIIKNDDPNCIAVRIMAKNKPRYPVPAWDLFTLKGYWRLPYAHGPKTKCFLPILTSRGCPYPCDFCVVPGTNNRRWRGNEPEHVAEEIMALRDRFGIHDFQLEDLNPTIDSRRFDELSRILINHKTGVKLYIVSGTKAETVPIESLPLWAKAGLRYISISPETGSTRLMKIIGKPFNYEHGVALVAACHQNRIRTQACFLVGHPSETEDDFKLSRDYMVRLIRAGVDEVAIFVVAAFAGSKLYANSLVSMVSKSSMPSFSPKGRVGFKSYERRRKCLIRIFFFEKLKKGLGIWMQAARALFGEPETKMENLPKRMLYIYWLILRYNLKKITG